MTHLSRSVRRRLTRRRLSPYVWGVVPVLSPHLDRLRRAAVGDHHSQQWRIKP